VRSKEGYAFEVTATAKKARAMQRYALQCSAHSLDNVPGFTRRGDLPCKQQSAQPKRRVQSKPSKSRKPLVQQPQEQQLQQEPERREPLQLQLFGGVTRLTYNGMPLSARLSRNGARVLLVFDCQSPGTPGAQGAPT
jgi:hypothetical protein